MKKRVRVYKPEFQAGGANTPEAIKQSISESFKPKVKKASSSALQNTTIDSFGQNRLGNLKQFLTAMATEQIVNEELNNAVMGVPPEPIFQTGGGFNPNANPYLNMYIDNMNSMNPSGAGMGMFDAFTNIVSDPGQYKMKTVIDKPYRKEYRQLNRDYNKDVRQNGWENWNDPYGIMRSYAPQFKEGGNLPTFQGAGEPGFWKRLRNTPDPSFRDIGNWIGDTWTHDILGEPRIDASYRPGTPEYAARKARYAQAAAPTTERDHRLDSYKRVRDIIDQDVDPNLTTEEYGKMIKDFNDLNHTNYKIWSGYKPDEHPDELPATAGNSNTDNSSTDAATGPGSNTGTSTGTGSGTGTGGGATTAATVQQALNTPANSTTPGTTGTVVGADGKQPADNSQSSTPQRGNATREELGLEDSSKTAQEALNRKTGNGQGNYNNYNNYGQFMDNPAILYPKVRGTFSRTGRMPLYYDPQYMRPGSVDYRRAILPGNRIKRVTFDNYMPYGQQSPFMFNNPIQRSSDNTSTKDFQLEDVERFLKDKFLNIPERMPNLPIPTIEQNGIYGNVEQNYVGNTVPEALPYRPSKLPISTIERSGAYGIIPNRASSLPISTIERNGAYGIIPNRMSKLPIKRVVDTRQSMRPGVFSDENVNANPESYDFDIASLIPEAEFKRGGYVPQYYVGGDSNMQVPFDYNNVPQRAPSLYDIEQEKYTSDPFANFTPRETDPNLVPDTNMGDKHWGQTFLTHSRNWAPMVSPAMSAATALGRKFTEPDWAQKIKDMTLADNVFTPGYGDMGFNAFNPVGFDPVKDATPVQFKGYAKCGGSVKKYQEGGEYNLSQEEIDAIIAAGGKVEFI